jgi:Protein of unknown function (DUF3592)
VNDWLPALFLVVLGGLMIFVGLRDIVRAHLTSSWPTTTGTMLAAEVGSTSGTRKFHCADLSFRYAVNGATYTSWRYSAAGLPGFFLLRTARRIVAQHRPGTHAVVAYPPSDPSRGILAPGVRPVLIAALRILAVGLAMLYFAWTFGKGALT